MKNSHIQWTHHTFNPWYGCTKVSEGCLNCYAECNFSNKLRGIKWGPNAERVRSTSLWKEPLAWNRAAMNSGKRARVFSASLADVFEDNPQVAGWRDELHELIRRTPQLDWLVLTKRPEVAASYYQANSVPENVWLGVSAENQARADQRIPVLLTIPARVRFMSCEPLLGRIDLSSHLSKGGVHWVIVGGETTFLREQVHRPMDLNWARSIREQCKAHGVAFFFKQVGGRMPKGRELAGYSLDGGDYHELPESARQTD